MSESPDRVSVGMGFKRSLGNYQTMDIHISLSSDAKSGENEEDVFRRVYDFVEQHFLAEFEETEEEVKEAIKKGQ